MRPIGKRVRDLAADLRHHLDRHGLVAFVFEIPRGPALGVVARDAFEVDHRAVLAALQAMNQRQAVDGIARDREEMPGRDLRFAEVNAAEPPLTGGRNATSSPSDKGAPGSEKL